MGIVEDLAPYMTLLRFSDNSDFASAFYEETYSNIPEPDPEDGTQQVQQYATSNPANGLLRRAAVDKDSRVKSLAVYFAPVADGENWRAVVRYGAGMLAGASEWTPINGEGDHEFVFETPVEIKADTHYVFGVEPESATQQATAFYFDLPVGVLPGDFKWQDKTLLRKSDPATGAWDNQVIAFGTWTNKQIRRVDYQTGQSFLWTHTTTGNAAVWAILDSGEVVGSDDATLLLLDPDDGSVLWSEALNDNIYYGERNGDLVYLMLANGQVAVADTTGATPTVTHYNVGIATSWLDSGGTLRGTSLSLSPDGSVIVIHDFSDKQIRAYDTSDIGGTLLWEHDYVGNNYSQRIAITPTHVYYGLDQSGKYLSALSLESGILTYQGDPVDASQYLHDIFADPNGEWLLIAGANGNLWRVYLDGDGAPTTYEEIDSGISGNREVGYAVSDGDRIYVSEGDDVHDLRVYDWDGNEIWSTQEWVSASNTYIYTARFALGVYNFSKFFTEVEADTPLAIRMVREVDYDPISAEGYLGGQRMWTSRVVTNFINEQVRALVPDVGLVNGDRSQVSAEAARDDESTWTSLTFGRRNAFAPQEKFRTRLSLKPADIVQDWSNWPGQANLTQNQEIETTSGNRLIVSFPDNMAGETAVDGFGRAWSGPGSTAYDHFAYGLAFEGNSPDGDVEWVSDWNNQCYFMFRCVEGDPNSHAYRLFFNSTSQVILEHGDGTDIATTPSVSNQFLDRQRWRAIWKGPNFWLFNNGSLVLSSGALSVQDEDRNWFAFNQYASSGYRLYKVRGRGMANGPTGGADRVNVDFFSAFHERAS